MSHWFIQSSDAVYSKNLHRLQQTFWEIGVLALSSKSGTWRPEITVMVAIHCMTRFQQASELDRENSTKYILHAENYNMPTVTSFHCTCFCSFTRISFENELQKKRRDRRDYIIHNNLYKHRVKQNLPWLNDTLRNLMKIRDSALKKSLKIWL